MQHPRFGTVKSWNDVRMDAVDVATYWTYYEIAATGQLLTAKSKIAFPSQEEVASAIETAGLAVETWFGDWQGGACTPTAREIIPFGRLR